MPFQTHSKRDCNALIKANGIDAAFKKFAGVEYLVTDTGLTVFHGYEEAYQILDAMPKNAITDLQDLTQEERDAKIVAMMDQPRIVMTPVV